MSHGPRGTGLPARSGAASSAHAGFAALHPEGMDRSVESRQDDERAIGAFASAIADPPSPAPAPLQLACTLTHAHADPRRPRPPPADPRSHAVRCGQAPRAKRRRPARPSTPSRPSR